MGLYTAILAHELKKPAERDAALKRIVSEGEKFLFAGKPRMALIGLARVWADAETSGGNGKIDLVELKRLYDDPGADRENFGYFAGRILQGMGLKDDGKEYLVQCSQSTRHKKTRSLARALLREENASDQPTTK
jgi:hypothetical protein